MLSLTDSNMVSLFMISCGVPDVLQYLLNMYLLNTSSTCTSSVPPQHVPPLTTQHAALQ